MFFGFPILVVPKGDRFGKKKRETTPELLTVAFRGGGGGGNTSVVPRTRASYAFFVFSPFCVPMVSFLWFQDLGSPSGCFGQLRYRICGCLVNSFHGTSTC